VAKDKVSKKVTFHKSTKDNVIKDKMLDKIKDKETKGIDIHTVNLIKMLHK
jgi:hypothetical protein